MKPSQKPLSFKSIPESKMIDRADNFYQALKNRRSVRDFSSQPIPHEVVERALLTAGTAPNGANLQPWHFVVVRNPAIKKEIRQAAELEEQAFYEHRASEDWLDVLSCLGTDANKPFLEEAPVLIIIFQKSEVISKRGKPSKTYYPKESVGIATGMLISALHLAGLATLTHTPSPMRFLNKILKRPSTEKPFLLLVVGYPKEDCMVPIINKKPLSETTTFYD